MTYIVSDLHGRFGQFQALLSDIHFGDDDLLYVLGDTVDYGDEPMELLADLSVRPNVLAVAGEHDYRAAKLLHGFDKMLRTGESPDVGYISEMNEWVKEGGQPTLEGFRALDADGREGILDYLGEMTLFEEAEVNGKKYLLLHEGLDGYREGSDIGDYPAEAFFAKPLDDRHPLIEGVTVIVGHIPTASGKIERGKNCIFMDCGAGQGGKIGCLCLETGEEFYA